MDVGVTSDCVVDSNPEAVTDEVETISCCELSLVDEAKETTDEEPILVSLFVVDTEDGTVELSSLIVTVTRVELQTFSEQTLVDKTVVWREDVVLVAIDVTGHQVVYSVTTPFSVVVTVDGVA